SFRRYFRITPEAPWRGRRTLIAMDAPPPMENCRPYIHVAKLLADAGVHAPEVLASDLERGFLLLTDLEPRTYLTALDASTARAPPRLRPRSPPTRSPRPFAANARRATLVSSGATTMRCSRRNSRSSPTGTSRGIAAASSRPGRRERSPTRSAWSSPAISPSRA